LTPRFDTIEDGVQYFADVDRSFLARPVLVRDVVHKERKFLVIQVARIALPWLIPSDRSLGPYRTGALGLIPLTYRTLSQSQEPMVSRIVPAMSNVLTW
jgi:hypothetical protein